MSKGKQDLRDYGSGELSNWVFNDEGLYRSRHNLESLKELLDEIFLYTDDQYDELVEDLEAELEEA